MNKDEFIEIIKKFQDLNEEQYRAPNISRDDHFYYLGALTVFSALLRRIERE